MARPPSHAVTPSTLRALSSRRVLILAVYAKIAFPHPPRGLEHGWCSRRGECLTRSGCCTKERIFFPMAFALSAQFHTTFSARSVRLGSRRGGLQTVRRKRICVRMAEGPTAPDGNTITNALEITFRTVWIRLMTAGVGQEYEAAIEQFVVACVTAYKAGYSMTALKLELAANESQGTDFMGRSTRLNEREKETRLIWIALVYMTLAKYGFSSENPPPPVVDEFKGTQLGDILQGLNALVDSIVAAAKRGYNLQTFKMELNLKKTEETRELSTAEANVRSQWSRIVFSTISILPESLKGPSGPRT